jgi:penicillin-binding protein-related factor A (putative recombinase)
MTPEVKVKKSLQKLCVYLGIKLNAAVATGYGRAGQLDFYGLYRGFYIGIETKATAKSKVTPLQLSEIQDIAAHDGAAMVIHAENVDDLRSWVAQVDEHWRVYDAARFSQ